MSAILIATCLLGLRPRFQDVSLPFGLHSYRQLATELTNVGIPTKCDSAILNRFALIRIPPKPWESFQRVLEAALDIQFVQMPSGSYEIRKNPREAEIEDALFRRFSRLYSQTIQDAVQDGWQEYRKIETSVSPRGASEPLANVLDAIRSLPSGSTDRNALSVAVNLKQELGRRYVYAELWDGIDLAKLLRGIYPVALTAEQVASAPPPDNPIGEITPPPIKSFRVRLIDGEAGLAPIQIDDWCFDYRTFSLARDHVEEVDITETGFGHGITEIVPDTVGLDCGWDELYKGLKGLAELRTRFAATMNWTTTAPANQSLNLANTDATVSSLFCKWSQASNQPLVMEVLPSRELLSDPNIPKSRPQTAAEFLQGKGSEAITPRFLRSSWTVEEVNGVTVVHDEIRFADHSVPFNPDAAVSLDSARTKAPTGLNTLSDLINAAALLPADVHDSLLGVDAYGVLADLPYASPYLRLIRSDPSSLQSLRALRKGQELRIPFTTFSASARRKFGQALHELSLRNASNWSAAVWPEFDQVLASSTLVVESKTVDRNSAIQFSLISPILKVPRTGLCLIGIGPVSLPD